MAGSSASNVSSSLTGSSGAHAPQGQLSQLAESAPTSSQQDATHPQVEGFDELLNGPAKAYFDLSKTIGDVVEEQVRIFTPQSSLFFFFLIPRASAHSSRA